MLSIRRLATSLLCLTTLAVAACDDDPVTSSGSAALFAEEVRAMDAVSVVYIYGFGELPRIYADGPREDAVRLDGITVDGTTLVVTTVGQGIHYYDLTKAKSLRVSDDLLVLSF